MITSHLKFWTLLILSLTAAAVFIFACSEEQPTEPEAVAPQIPPLSSFLMDFSDFPSEGKGSAGGSPAGAKLFTRDNYTWASVHVGVWSLLISVGLAVPTAAFVESFAHRPVQLPNGAWVWSYSLTVNGQEYSAELHGSIGNFGTQWQMYVTEHGVYENFLWYSGQADLFLTEGTWTLNKHPEDPIPLLLIEWHRSIEDSTGDIRYTNIEPGGAENGGYIFHGTTPDTVYDAFYDIYNKGQDHLIEIEWNLTDKDGRIRDAVHFQDEDWHCWDPNRQDIDCP